jgi:hypothetical protein
MLLLAVFALFGLTSQVKATLELQTGATVGLPEEVPTINDTNESPFRVHADGLFDSGATRQFISLMGHGPENVTDFAKQSNVSSVNLLENGFADVMVASYGSSGNLVTGNTTGFGPETAGGGSVRAGYAGFVPTNCIAYNESALTSSAKLQPWKILQDPANAARYYIVSGFRANGTAGYESGLVVQRLTTDAGAGNANGLDSTYNNGSGYSWDVSTILGGLSSDEVMFVVNHAEMVSVNNGVNGILVAGQIKHDTSYSSYDSSWSRAFFGVMNPSDGTWAVAPTMLAATSSITELVLGSSSANGGDTTFTYYASGRSGGNPAVFELEFFDGEGGENPASLSVNTGGTFGTAGIFTDSTYTGVEAWSIKKDTGGKFNVLLSLANGTSPLWESVAIMKVTSAGALDTSYNESASEAADGGFRVINLTDFANDFPLEYEKTYPSFSYSNKNLKIYLDGNDNSILVGNMAANGMPYIAKINADATDAKYAKAFSYDVDVNGNLVPQMKASPILFPFAGKTWDSSMAHVAASHYDSSGNKIYLFATEAHVTRTTSSEDVEMLSSNELIKRFSSSDLSELQQNYYVVASATLDIELNNSYTNNVEGDITIKSAALNAGSAIGATVSNVELYAVSTTVDASTTGNVQVYGEVTLNGAILVPVEGNMTVTLDANGQIEENSPIGGTLRGSYAGGILSLSLQEKSEASHTETPTAVANAVSGTVSIDFTTVSDDDHARVILTNNSLSQQSYGQMSGTPTLTISDINLGEPVLSSGNNTVPVNATVTLAGDGNDQGVTGSIELYGEIVMPTSGTPLTVGAFTSNTISATATSVDGNFEHTITLTIAEGTETQEAIDQLEAEITASDTVRFTADNQYNSSTGALSYRIESGTLVSSIVTGSIVDPSDGSVVGSVDMTLGTLTIESEVQTVSGTATNVYGSVVATIDPSGSSEFADETVTIPLHGQVTPTATDGVVDELTTSDGINGYALLTSATNAHQALVIVNLIVDTTFNNHQHNQKDNNELSLSAAINNLTVDALYSAANIITDVKEVGTGSATVTGDDITSNGLAVSELKLLSVEQTLSETKDGSSDANSGSIAVHGHALVGITPAGSTSEYNAVSARKVHLTGTFYYIVDRDETNDAKGNEFGVPNTEPARTGGFGEVTGTLYDDQGNAHTITLSIDSIDATNTENTAPSTDLSGTVSVGLENLYDVHSNYSVSFLSEDNISITGDPVNGYSLSVLNIELAAETAGQLLVAGTVGILYPGNQVPGNPDETVVVRGVLPITRDADGQISSAGSAVLGQGENDNNVLTGKYSLGSISITVNDSDSSTNRRNSHTVVAYVNAAVANTYSSSGSAISIDVSEDVSENTALTHLVNGIPNSSHLTNLTIGGTDAAAALSEPGRHHLLINTFTSGFDLELPGGSSNSLSGISLSGVMTVDLNNDFSAQAPAPFKLTGTHTDGDHEDTDVTVCVIPTVTNTSS